MVDGAPMSGEPVMRVRTDGLRVLGSLSTAVAQLWLSGELWRWGRRSASRRIRSLNFGTPIASRT